MYSLSHCTTMVTRDNDNNYSSCQLTAHIAPRTLVIHHSAQQNVASYLLGAPVWRSVVYSPKASQVSVILHPCCQFVTVPTIWSSVRTRPCLHHRSLDLWRSISCMTCSPPAHDAYTPTLWRRGHEAEEETWLKRRSQTSNYATNPTKM